MSLIERLEGAGRSTAGLDLALGRELHLIDLNLIYKSADGSLVSGVNSTPWPRWTNSFDAALSLCGRILPGWHLAHMGERREADDYGLYVGDWSVRLHRTEGGKLYNLAYGIAQTPALAMCVAILNAKEME